MLSGNNIAIIGTGTMGRGLAERLSQSYNLFLYDHHYDKALSLEQKGFGKACPDLKTAIDNADIVILAIKPQSLKEAAPLIGSLLTEQTLISLLAGTTINTLKTYFPNTRIIRMMPNLAITKGEGLVGLTPDSKLSENEIMQLLSLSDPLGKVFWLSEEKINAFTALGGSGPAFVLVMIESMVEAGIAMGFNAKDSEQIVKQMVKGSLSLLDSNDKHPGEIKWQISSPAGTTIAGLLALEDLNVRSGIINVFLACFERTNELSSD